MASQISGHLSPSSDYESIATATITSNTQQITFSSIPQTYTHLQVRLMTRTNRAIAIEGINIWFNGDFSSNLSPYTFNIMYDANGTQGSVYSTSDSRVSQTTGSTQTANYYGVAIADILNYTNTNMKKSVRAFTAAVPNGSAYLYYFGNQYNSTSAITSMTFNNGGTTDSFIAGTKIALYGLKG